MNNLRLELLRKLANDINHISIKPNLSYSYIMRKLRKDNDEDKIKIFQETFKKTFDKAMSEGHINFHDLALISAIEAIDFSDEDNESSDDIAYIDDSKIPPYWSTNYDYINIPVDKTHESFAPYTPSDMHNTYSNLKKDEYITRFSSKQSRRSKLLKLWIDRFKKKYNGKSNYSNIDKIPNIGVYDNWTGFRGVSPVDNTIGLFNI